MNKKLQAEADKVASRLKIDFEEECPAQGVVESIASIISIQNIFLRAVVPALILLVGLTALSIGVAKFYDSVALLISFLIISLFFTVAGGIVLGFKNVIGSTIEDMKQVVTFSIGLVKDIYLKVSEGGRATLSEIFLVVMTRVITPAMETLIKDRIPIFKGLIYKPVEMILSSMTTTVLKVIKRDEKRAGKKADEEQAESDELHLEGEERPQVDEVTVDTSGLDKALDGVEKASQKSKKMVYSVLNIFLTLVALLALIPAAICFAIFTNI